MERTDRIPLGGMALEVELGGGSAVGPDGGEAGYVGDGPMIARFALPGIDGGEQRVHPIAVAEAKEHPAPLLAPLGESGIGEDLHVARDAGLALAQHLREFAHRKLHRAQQREDAQPGRIGKRAEDGEFLSHGK
jgi:hypothetical protein